VGSPTAGNTKTGKLLYDDHLGTWTEVEKSEKQRSDLQVFCEMKAHKFESEAVIHYHGVTGLKLG